MDYGSARLQLRSGGDPNMGPRSSRVGVSSSGMTWSKSGAESNAPLRRRKWI